MKYVYILFWGLMLIGCDTTHKLTGTDYVDLESEQAPPVVTDYPSAITKAVGWDDITTDLKPKGTEEIRFWLTSTVYPSHLIKLTKSNKGEVEGEVILYWPNDTTLVQQDFTHQKLKHYLEGMCTEFHTAGLFGYCYPGLDEDIRWGTIYTAIESQDFWQLQAGVNTADTEKNWKMYVQMRLRNYYRDYQHVNSHAYEDEALKGEVISLVRAVRLINNRFHSANENNLFEGITDGTSFTLCDSSETWEFMGDLNQLLENAGLKTNVKTEKEQSLYYTLMKGRIAPVWYDAWATGEFDRRFFSNEIYDIRAVNDFKCPEELVSY